MTYHKVQQTHPIPENATADTVAEMVRALLAVPVRISQIVIRSQSENNGRGEIVVDMYVRGALPPDGDPLDSPPESLWATLLGVSLTELRPKDNSALNLDPIRAVASMLHAAALDALAGVVWLVGSMERLGTWLTPKKLVRFSSLMNIPIVVMEELPEDVLVLLCARSKTTNPLEATAGFKIVMEQSDG